MKYYKDKDNIVFAYDTEQLLQVERLSGLELLLQEKEPLFLTANENLQQSTLELNEANELLNITVANSVSDDEEAAIENDEEIQRVKLIVADKTKQLEDATTAFSQIESEHQPLKDEYDSILHVFFDIREHLNTLKKMTTKEVEAYLNPPIPKEQLIAEAEQRKQSLLVEANNAIAPLQDAVDLDMATDEEITLLKKWKKYRVLLNRLDVSDVDVVFPEQPA